jgi:ATP-binding cassette subfamily B protein
MGLLRDLWATSPRRAALMCLVVLLGAAGSAAALALAGPVLVHRSQGAFTLLVIALLVAVFSDVALGLLSAGLTADWTADIRRRLCRAAFGQDVPKLETTPVGELLDRIDGDVSQVASELRGSGVRIAQTVTISAFSMVTALLVWWPAGLAMLALVACSSSGCASG